jgi:hypothetical protein
MFFWIGEKWRKYKYFRTVVKSLKWYVHRFKQDNLCSRFNSIHCEKCSYSPYNWDKLCYPFNKYYTDNLSKRACIVSVVNDEAHHVNTCGIYEKGIATDNQSAYTPAVIDMKNYNVLIRCIFLINEDNYSYKAAAKEFIRLTPPRTCLIREGDDWTY